MGERIRNLLGALAALVLLFVLVAPPSQIEPRSKPTSDDNRASGYSVLNQWLQASGHKVVSHRYRFDRLNDYPGKNILLLTFPFHTPVQRNEWVELIEWLSLGNRLVILADPLTTDSWAYSADRDTHRLFSELGVNAPGSSISTDCTDTDQAECSEPDLHQTIEQPNAEEDNETVARQVLDEIRTLTEAQNFSPAFAHDLFSGVEGIELVRPWTLPDDHFDASTELAVPLLRADSDGSVAGWLLRTEAIPDGFFIFTDADIFNNQGLAEVGQQHLAGNFMYLYAAPGGRFIFDDFHQGLSDLYDAKAFFADSRLWWSILALALIWFAYVGFVNARLGPVRDEDAEISNASFARRVAAVYARHTPIDQVNKRLLQGFNDHYRRQHHLPTTGESVLRYVREDYHYDERDVTLLELLEEKRQMNPLKTQQQLSQLYRKQHVSKTSQEKL